MHFCLPLATVRTSAGLQQTRQMERHSAFRGEGDAKLHHVSPPSNPPRGRRRGPATRGRSRRRWRPGRKRPREGTRRQRQPERRTSCASVSTPATSHRREGGGGGGSGGGGRAPRGRPAGRDAADHPRGQCIRCVYGRRAWSSGPTAAAEGEVTQAGGGE
jgi:hypothetical protein